MQRGSERFRLEAISLVCLSALTVAGVSNSIIAVVCLLGRLLEVLDMESFLVWSSRNRPPVGHVRVHSLSRIFCTIKKSFVPSK